MAVIKFHDDLHRLYTEIQTGMKKLLSQNNRDSECLKLVRLAKKLKIDYEALPKSDDEAHLAEMESALKAGLQHIYPDWTDNERCETRLAIIDLFQYFLHRIQDLSEKFAPEIPEPAKNNDSPAIAEPAQLQSAASISPAEEAATKTDEIAKVPLSQTELLDSLPPSPEPALYFLLDFKETGGNSQLLYDTLKHLIDSAEPIMGETGKSFFYTFHLDVDKLASVTAVKANPQLVNELGLQVSLEDQMIVLRGCPPAGYDGPLHFTFARQDQINVAGFHKKPMYIAADPRTLWRDLPVEDFEGYPVENEAVASQHLPICDKTVWAASCRGRSHAHSAKPRDDHFAFDFDPESGWNFVAVADGAGSAKYSRKGSEIACQTVVSFLRNHLAAPKLIKNLTSNEERLREWKTLSDEALNTQDSTWENDFRSEFYFFDSIMHHAVSEAYKAIEQEAGQKNAQIRDYHTTTLCAAFKKFNFGYLFLSYWIGDGGMALYNWNDSDRVLVPGAPDGGEFAGQTLFLTVKEEISEEAVKQRTRLYFANDFEALILMTDGVTDPFFFSEKDVTSEASWQRFWNENLKKGDDDNPGCPELFNSDAPPEAAAKALRRWLDFWSKGNHDDRTILIVK